jgi:hypothetical protein
MIKLTASRERDRMPQPTLTMTNGSSTTDLRFPEVIAWSGKEWFPVSSLGVWNNETDEWELISLDNTVKRMTLLYAAATYLGLDDDPSE